MCKATLENGASSRGACPATSLLPPTHPSTLPAAASDGDQHKNMLLTLSKPSLQKSWKLSVPNPFPKDTEFASFCLLPEREETCHHCSACAPSQPLLLSCRRGFAPHCTEVALLCDAFAVDGATAPTPNVFLLPPPPPKDI